MIIDIAKLRVREISETGTKFPFCIFPVTAKNPPNLQVGSDGRVHVYREFMNRLLRSISSLGCMLRRFTDHSQGCCSAAGLPCRDAFLRVPAALLGGALSPTGKLAQGYSRSRLHAGKFWLDSGSVDSFIVEEVFNALRYVHISGGILAFDVSGGDDAAFGQLPDVQFVDSLDAFQTSELLFQGGNVDLFGDRLQ